MKTKEQNQLPLWNLDNIYKNFDDENYKKDIELFLNNCDKLKKHLTKKNPELQEQASYLEDALKLYENIHDIYENLNSYVYAIFSVNTSDSRAIKEMGFLEEQGIKLTEISLMLQQFIAKTKENITEMLKQSEYLKNYELFIKEAIIEVKHTLSAPEEKLAEELSTAGGQAWGRLQEALASELECKWDKNTKERKTVNDLRNLAYSPDRETRKKAFKKELKAWKKMATPLAYALNGVKKTAIILDEKRGWKSPVEKALFQSRMSEKTLNAMISTMEDALPHFRKYLNKKAQLLGLDKLSFYDLFAPVSKEGETLKNWSYQEAKQFIIENFTSFSQDMGKFAQHAFKNNWIDAPPRQGKTGGAYCTSFPLAEESRVMCNYSHTFSGVSTVAHELGHAYHHEILKKAGSIARAYPMTLAETASVFAETLISNNAIKQAEGFQKLSLTETFLQEITQTIVDILCRFYFEKEIFKRIKEGLLTADEFCEIMTDCQKKTYGDALDCKALHPYMWAVKCHYYFHDLGFYNYPYAFGQLFSIGLYEKYLEEPQAFPEIYKKMLGMTGKADIKDVAAIAGFNVEDKRFFQKSMKFITDMIDEFCKTEL